MLALVFLSKWVVTIINSQMKRVNGYLMAVLQLQFTMCLPLFNFTLLSYWTLPTTRLPVHNLVGRQREPSPTRGGGVWLST